MEKSVHATLKAMMAISWPASPTWSGVKLLEKNVATLAANKSPRASAIAQTTTYSTRYIPLSRRMSSSVPCALFCV